MAFSFQNFGEKYGLVLAILVGAAIFGIPTPAGMSLVQHKLLSLFGGAIVLWITMGVNFAVSTIITTTLLYFWVGNATGAVKNGELVRSTAFALNGFASNSVWLLITGFIISIAMTTTGVAKRLSLLMIRWLGRTPFGALMASMLTNYMLSPLTPANTARTASMLPIIEGIAQSYRAVPGQSNFGRALALSATFAGNITASAFLTGTIANPTALAVVISAAGTSVYTTWSFWALAAAPTNLLILFITGWLLLRIFPPEMKEVPGGLAYVEEELKKMGTMSRDEKYTIFSFAVALGLWATDRFHGFNATMVAFVASTLIFMPHIGVLDWKKTQNSLPWELFMYFGGVLTLSSALVKTKSIEFVMKSAITSLGLESLSMMPLLIILIGVTIFGHIVWSTTTVMAGVMFPIYVGIAQAMGFDVAKFCLPLCIMIAYALFLPFNTMGNIIIMGTGFYTITEQFKSSLILGLIIWVMWIITAFTWWKIIGLT